MYIYIYNYAILSTFPLLPILFDQSPVLHGHAEWSLIKNTLVQLRHSLQLRLHSPVSPWPLILNGYLSFATDIKTQNHIFTHEPWATIYQIAHQDEEPTVEVSEEAEHERLLICPKLDLAQVQFMLTCKFLSLLLPLTPCPSLPPRGLSFFRTLFRSLSLSRALSLPVLTSIKS